MMKNKERNLPRAGSNFIERGKIMIDSRIMEDYCEAYDIVEKFVGKNVEYYPYIHKVYVSRKMTRILGRCYSKRDAGGMYHEIGISWRLLDEKYPREQRMKTLIHEILHAFFPREKHGGKWKVYADIISRKTEYNIQRYADEEEMIALREVEKFNYKYMVVCQNCGKEVRKNRMSDIIRRPFAWRCGKCKEVAFKRVA